MMYAETSAGLSDKQTRATVPPDIAIQLRALYRSFGNPLPPDAFSQGATYSPVPVRLDPTRPVTFARPLAHEQFVLAETGLGVVIAPHHLVTTRRMVQLPRIGRPDAIRIIDPSDSTGTTEWPCTLVAVSPRADLALLQCSALRRVPLPLATVPPAGHPIVLLGTSGWFGDSPSHEPELIRGVVVSSVGRSGSRLSPVDLFLLRTAVELTDGGGPVCDVAGRLVGLSTSRFQSVLSPCGLSAGISASAVAEFVRQHVNSVGPITSELPREDVRDVRLFLQQATVVLRVYVRGLAATVIRGNANLPKDDQARPPASPCPKCGGTGEVDCPNCRRGRSKIRRPVVVARNPQTGQPIIQQRFYSIECTTCGGKGRLDCPLCGERGTRDTP
ncbi:MAG: hypothetical protein GXP27_00895 [Planctomycetes bacterium]|nr:hypothetical protein [Planctomycetota bacterium]